MAERKSGPVKPPVIDLTARPAGDAKPDTGKPEAKAAESPKPTEPAKAPEASKPAEPAKPAEAMRPPKPTPPAPGRRTPAIAGGIGGAVLATAVCYGLAYAGLWPLSAGETTGRLDQLEQRLAQSEKTGASAVTALADLNTHLSGLGD